VLQHWGTEVCRHGFHDDIWIAALENRLRSRTGNTVISDVRFPNEIKAIKNAGGKIVWVQRGVTPHWYEIALMANKGDTKAQQWLVDNKIHASETAWVGTDFDTVINNDKSIEDLYTQLKNLV
jgi:predicted HTH transcriptional regulator